MRHPHHVFYSVVFCCLLTLTHSAFGDNRTLQNDSIPVTVPTTETVGVSDPGLPVHVAYGEPITLTERQKQEILDAPAWLLPGVSEHLQQALDAQDVKHAVVAIDDSEPSMPIHAMIHYEPIAVSETRLFEPTVVCNAQRKPLKWTRCKDISSTYVTLPGLEPIQVNKPFITAEKVEMMLAFLDEVSPSNNYITSKNVQGVFWRGDRIGIYAVPTTGGIVNLRPVMKDGRETYELAKFSRR